MTEDFTLLDRAVAALRTDPGPPPSSLEAGTIRTLVERDLHPLPDPGPTVGKRFGLLGMLRLRPLPLQTAAIMLLGILILASTPGALPAVRYVGAALMLSGVLMRWRAETGYMGEKDWRRTPLVLHASDFQGGNRDLLLGHAGTFLMLAPIGAIRLASDQSAAPVAGLACYLAGILLREVAGRAFADPVNRPTSDFPWRQVQRFEGPGFVIYLAGCVLVVVGALLLFLGWD